jgi:hypothetical protein
MGSAAATAGYRRSEAWGRAQDIAKRRRSLEGRRQIRQRDLDWCDWWQQLIDQRRQIWGRRVLWRCCVFGLRADLGRHARMFGKEVLRPGARRPLAQKIGEVSCLAGCSLGDGLSRLRHDPGHRSSGNRAEAGEQSQSTPAPASDPGANGA